MIVVVRQYDLESLQFSQLVEVQVLTLTAIIYILYSRVLLFH